MRGGFLNSTRMSVIVRPKVLARSRYQRRGPVHTVGCHEKRCSLNSEDKAVRAAGFSGEQLSLNDLVAEEGKSRFAGPAKPSTPVRCSRFRRRRRSAAEPER